MAIKAKIYNMLTGITVFITTFGVLITSLATPVHATGMTNNVLVKGFMGIYGKQAAPADALVFNSQVNTASTGKVTSPTEVINSILVMPPCNKVATSKLVNSCQIPDDENTNIESVSNYYAANLAVCELSDAAIELPSACNVFNLSHDMDKVATLGLFSSGMLTDPALSYRKSDGKTMTAMTTCIKALSTKPQWWTSFSNNKQNAYQICNAYRGQVEREQLIDAISVMAEKTNDLDAKLFASITSAEQIVSVLDNLRDIHAKEQQTWSKVAAEFSQSLSAAHDKLTGQARDELNLLSTHHEHVLDMFSNGMNHVNQLLQQVQGVNGELSHAGSSARGILDGLAAMSNQLVITNENVMTLNQATSAFTVGMDETITKLQSSADELNRTFEPLQRLAEGFMQLRIVKFLSTGGHALSEMAWSISLMTGLLGIMTVLLCATTTFDLFPAMMASFFFTSLLTLAFKTIEDYPFDSKVKHLLSVVIGVLLALYLLAARCSRSFSLTAHVALLSHIAEMRAIRKEADDAGLDEPVEEDSDLNKETDYDTDDDEDYIPFYEVKVGHGDV